MVPRGLGLLGPCPLGPALAPPPPHPTPLTGNLTPSCFCPSSGQLMVTRSNYPGPGQLVTPGQRPTVQISQLCCVSTHLSLDITDTGHQVYTIHSFTHTITQLRLLRLLRKWKREIITTKFLHISLRKNAAGLTVPCSNMALTLLNS